MAEKTPSSHTDQGLTLLHTLGGHTSSVSSVAWSPDGKYIASGSHDQTIRLWDATTGAALRSLEGHTDWVYSVAWSPDGKTIASGSFDRTIRLWDSTTGAVLRTLQGHTDSVYSVAWSPDGKTIASSSRDRSIRLWDAATGAVLHTLEDHTSSVNSVAWSPDGKTIASGSRDRSIRLWDSTTGAVLRTLEGHTSSVNSVAWSPDGQTIASGSNDNTIRLWDSTTGTALRTLEDYTDWVYSVAWSPDGKTIASSSHDRTIRLWDSTTGTALRTLQGHTASVNSVMWSPDGKTIVSSSDDQTIRLWDSTTGAVLRTLQGHTESVSSVAWSPDGQTIVSGSRDRTIRLWNATTGAALRTLEGHTDWVSSVAWSPDGQTIASGSADTTIRLWDSTTGVVLRTLGDHTNSVSSVAWSPDGQTIVSGSRDRTIRLWNATTGAALRTLEGHTESVYSVAWSPNGKTIVSGTNDRTIRLWDAATGTMLRTLNGHNASVSSVAWSPDGQTIASGSHDRTIRLWNATTGAALRTLEGHTESVYSVVWSPDGRLLASHSSSSHVEGFIWHTDTWEPVATLTSLGGLTDTSWHPVHPCLATIGKQSREIAIWQLDLQSLLGASTFSTMTHYTNAKVVLMGDSGVGKSGLGLVLSGQPFILTESTHGRHVWNFDHQEVSLDEQRRETRETLLWDLAGQPGYRLIHQLHLSEVVVALIVFDAHSETDPFAGVSHWDRALRLAQRISDNSALPLKKLLVAARTDRGGAGASAERIEALMRELGFDGYFATSAKEGWQIDELHDAICEAIDWQALPKVTSTVLFRQIKQFLLDEKQQAKRLISSVGDLYSTFLRSKDAPEETPELPAQFETCIGRIESTDLIKRLSFGNLVLLQPELLDAYASALVNFVKDEPDGLGSIAEEQVRAGDFRMSADERIPDKEQEKLLLIAMIEDLLRRELALREEGMLVFPSQSTKENFDLPDPEGKAVVFTFEGPILNIYATLAVRLARSSVFKKKQLWRNAVTYMTILNGTCGIYLRNSGEGRGELTLFFDHIASLEARHAFTEYVHLYLSRRALPDSFNARYVLTCSACNEVISENTIRRRKERNFDWLPCPVCETRVSLVENAQQRVTISSSRTDAIDQIADKQREREAAQLILQGKIATGDFDVFLCHNTIDKPIVKQIGEQLKEQGILPWLDEWELRPGFPWQQLLGEQIEHIKSVAVFVGKDGFGPWQDLEIMAFLREFVQRNCPVIPVLLADAGDKPKLPPLLGSMGWVNFRVKDSDPLQRLLWGITGRRDME